ncbi:multiubiquitin domain-containing protein [Geomonas nitrogeniifigens]|uniref:Multiubiquitin domain-containing protein n=1 Tax=Geomonas diazotrophica TaxID=2843197 RepID=A0ABX8JG33_9BACT|nr:multiubiquitin domain-containing protein [Geomonas nitrogeniifigens]QWV97278.1 multiubiquitin domain-containing protein [Geomonas nitrogeniifigens]
MSKKYHFKIENVPYEWDREMITEQEIRAVGPGIPETMDLFVKVAGKPGRLVESGESFDLSDPGIEKFYSQESSSEAGAC